jgi:hypothetical protein
MAGEMVRYQLSKPLEPGCGGDCRVYDGRILAGIGWYLLAHKAEHGQYFGTEAAGRVMKFAAECCAELNTSRGWYDEGCFEEGGCHSWCGNMNLLNGLLPVRRMMKSLRARNHEEATELWPRVEGGIRGAMRFLTITCDSVTDRPSFVPSRTFQWAAGNMYEICGEYRRQVEEDDGVRRLMDHLVLGAGAKIVSCFHRNNASGAMLMHCPEYRGLREKPPLPWDAAGA